MNEGIPTTHKGVRFRSRLESKWACFFDLLGWKWEYEPFDLDGWIPDFLIKTKTEPNFFLVEIKPFLSIKEFEKSGTINKIMKSGATREVLLCGAGLIDTGWHAGFSIGWFLERDDYGYCTQFGDGGASDVQMGIINGSTWDFYPGYNYTCRITGERYKALDYDDTDDQKARLISFWKQAANMTQWHKGG